MRKMILIAIIFVFLVGTVSVGAFCANSDGKIVDCLAKKSTELSDAEKQTNSNPLISQPKTPSKPRPKLIEKSKYQYQKSTDGNSFLVMDPTGKITCAGMCSDIMEFNYQYPLGSKEWDATYDMPELWGNTPVIGTGKDSYYLNNGKWEPFKLFGKNNEYSGIPSGKHNGIDIYIVKSAFGNNDVYDSSGKDIGDYETRMVKNSDGSYSQIPVIEISGDSLFGTDDKLFRINSDGTKGDQLSDDEISYWKWAFSGEDGLILGMDTLQRALSGYTWMSLFYDAEDEGKILESMDNAFSRFILKGPREAFVSHFCKDEVSSSEDTRTIVGGSSGGYASAWMAAEKTPYTRYNTTTKRNVSGFIYKVNAEADYGSCTKMYIQLYHDSTPLIIEASDGGPYTYKMGSNEESSAMLSFTGTNTLIFFSTANYATVSMKFTDLSSGCLLDVNRGDTVSWSIKAQDEAYAAYTAALLGQNSGGSGSSSGGSDSGNTPSGPRVNP